MRITKAAQALGTSPRMLRYRESLGLLPPVQPRRARARRARASWADVTDVTAAAGQVTATGIGAGASGAADVSGADWTRHGTDRAGGHGPSRAAEVSGADWTRHGTEPAAGHRAAGRGTGQAAGHRQFSEADLAAVALGLSIERRYDISPAALSFAIRVLADPRVRAEVAELGRRIGRIQPLPARALDFEQERALRLLRLDPPRS